MSSSFWHLAPESRDLFSSWERSNCLLSWANKQNGNFFTQNGPTPYPSPLDYWNIWFEKSSSTKWIFCLFWTRFLQAAHSVIINPELRIGREHLIDVNIKLFVLIWRIILWSHCAKNGEFREIQLNQQTIRWSGCYLLILQIVKYSRNVKFSSNCKMLNM